MAFSYSHSSGWLTAVLPRHRMMVFSRGQAGAGPSFSFIETRSITMAAKDRDLNRDPTAGEPASQDPGAHPVGTGIGAVGGAMAGAAAGAVGGPAGMAVGGV